MISRSFVCTQCGDCCRGFGAGRFVPLTRDDVAQLAAYHDVSEEEFRQVYTEVRSLSVGADTINIRSLKQRGGDCIFLDASDLCSVHEAKPFLCRNSPEFLLRKSMARDFECMKGLAQDDDCEIEAEFIQGVIGS